MMFGIIIVSIFIILALLCFVIVIMALKENIKDKRRGKKTVFQANFMAGIGIIGFLFLAISLSVLVHTVSPYTNKEQNNTKCQVCGREFQKGSENAKSIRKTNMCTQCYENYRNAADALKELPVNEN